MNRKTPQQKKALSLARDRRNAYGENSKSSRKNIPRSKALARRKLNAALGTPSPENNTREPAAAAIARKSGWRKCPDVPLAEHLDRKQKTAARRARSA